MARVAGVDLPREKRGEVERLNTLLLAITGNIEVGAAVLDRGGRIQVWNERAADLWQPTRGAGLSLGDRACLALARRLDVTAVTADRAWLGLDVGVDVNAIR